MVADVAEHNSFSGKLDRDGEIFLVAYLDGYMFYVPRLQKAALIDRALGDALRQEVDSVGLNSMLLQALAKHVQLPITWREDLSSVTPKQPWAPTTVIFSNTQKCTLRCRYCYADGGRLEDADIDLAVAEHAIELVCTNAKALDARPAVIFLGEGEATANWETFTHIIDYFRCRCKDTELIPFVQLSTNGVFSKTKVPYIVENCESLTVSIDGLPKAHDAHRVLPNGRGSFALISDTLREFDALGKGYAIWTTATRDSTASLSAFVEWVGENTACKEVHVDPVFNMQGLAKTAEETEHVQAETFVAAFREARSVGARFDISLEYSPANTGVRTSFCGAANAANFLVTSKGMVTSCNEVLRRDDPRAELFKYGEWNSEKKAFEIDASAIERLSRLNVREIKKCQGCFAKYNCAGDCYARSTGGGANPWAGDYTVRCTITRDLLRDNLALALMQGQAART